MVLHSILLRGGNIMVLGELQSLNELLLSMWASPASSSRRLLRAMRKLESNNLIQDIVKGLLRDREALQQIAKRSFDHPTGVSKIILTDLGPSLPEMRLHFWPPIAGRDGNELSIHDHRWDFCSNLCFGSLQHEIFRESPIGDAYFGIKFLKVQGQPIYDIINLGKVGLTLSKCEILSPGTSYILPSTDLHRMTNHTTDLACTLFLRGPYVRSDTVVYHSKRDALVQGSYPGPLPVETAERLLKIVAERSGKGAA